MKRPNPRLAEATLPIMQETGAQLRHLLTLNSTRNRQLQHVLLSDPAAAIAIFRELELIRPGSCEQVSDPAHAVSLIGLQCLQRVLEALPEVDRRDCGPAARRCANVAYSQAAHAAFYAHALAQRRGINGNEEISTAALLQNPAILALWALEPESALRASNAARDGVSLEIAFGAELGEALEQANQRLAATWALPRLARQAMGDWDDFNPRPQLVKLADGLAQTTAAGWQHEGTTNVTLLLSEFLDVSADEACAWLHQRAGDAARALSHLDYPLPGFELVYLPLDAEPEEEDDHRLPEFGRRRRKTPPGQPDLHATMTELMRRIREETRSGRVVFAMLSQDHRRLRTRLALGGDKDDGLRRLDLDMQHKNLFTLLLGKPQSVWLNQDTSAKYRAYLPAELQRLLDPNGAFVMSLFAGERPLGLLYGDGASLDEQGYRRFRELCGEATTALAAGSRVAPRTTPGIPHTPPS